MATRKPLVIVSGQVQELPVGDVPAGAEPSVTAGTNAQFWRGDKSWQDFATDVRAAVLTGLSTATNAAITAADTVLAALGKLQAQVSAKFDKAGGEIGGSVGIGKAADAGVKLDVAGPVQIASGTDNGYLRFKYTTVNVASRSWRVGSDISAYGDFRLQVTTTQAGSTFSDVMSVDSATGNVLVHSGAIGYGLGTGGTVTQPTDKSTAVTLNKPSGTITMNAASLAAGAAVWFSQSNTMVRAADTVVANLTNEGVANPTSYELDVLVGDLIIYYSLRNRTGAALAEAVRISFTLHKGSRA